MAQEYRPVLAAAETVSTGSGLHLCQPTCRGIYAILLLGADLLPTEHPATFRGHKTGSAELVPAMPRLSRLRQGDGSSVSTVLSVLSTMKNTSCPSWSRRDCSTCSFRRFVPFREAS